MGRRGVVTSAVAVVLLSSTAYAESKWPKAEHSAFVAGCALAIVAPAKRDYALAAERAGDANPKPFPEDQLRASVEPMCGCIAERIAESGLSYRDSLKIPDAVTPMIREALAGGRCKPGGLLGKMFSQELRGTGDR